MTDLPEAAETADLFHETYERLAPDFGYRTREASAKPWADVPEQNRALMIATCAEVGAHIRADERAQVLAEVQAALLDDGAWRAWYRAKNPDRSWALGDEFPRFVTPQERATLADYLRDTVGAGGEG